MVQLFVAAGSLLALVGIVARSLSSHALLQLLTERGKLANFNLAADYLLIHGLALIAVAILGHLFPEAKYLRPGWFLLAGSLLFQGTVLIKSLVAIQPFGFVTPIGGFLLMAGWGLLILSALHRYRLGS